MKKVKEKQLLFGLGRLLGSCKLEKCYKKILDGNDLIFHNLEISGHHNKLIKKQILRGRKLYKPYFKDLIINGNHISNSR